MRNTGPIKITKLHPLFGAEVEGIDITRPLSAREFGPIRAAFEEHSVLLFRDQHMTDETQVQFSENFGPLETTGASNPAAGTKFQRQSNLDPGLVVTGRLTNFGYEAGAGSVLVRYDAALAASGGTRVETRRFEARVPADGTAATVGPALNAAANQVAADVAKWIGG